MGPLFGAPRRNRTYGEGLGMRRFVPRQTLSIQSAVASTAPPAAFRAPERVSAAKADLLAALTALEKVRRLLIAGAAGTDVIEQSPTFFDVTVPQLASVDLFLPAALCRSRSSWRRRSGSRPGLPWDGPGSTRRAPV